MTEPDVSQLVSVDQAIAIIDREPVQPRVMEAELSAADGLVLAQDLKADRDYPPFDKSQMDGFAVLAGSQTELKVLGEVAAGRWPEMLVKEGEAVAVMTGAPVPRGANAVVPVEDVEDSESEISDSKSQIPDLRKIRLTKAPVAGKYIAKKGSDVQAGRVVLRAGTRVSPAQLAVASSVGAHKIKVFARPAVAVLATGDELVNVDETPGPAQIRNSNNIMLVSLLKRWGCPVRDLGIVPDQPQEIRAAIREGLSDDVLLVTGGMSMGEYDYVPKILHEMGIEFRITKLRIKPGKPFVFGVGEGSKFVFGLPGNPVSGFVCAVRLASRLIDRLSGQPAREKWVQGTLSAALPPNGPREFYQPAVIENGRVTVLGWKGSADLVTLAQANALLVRKENEPPRQPGEVVKLLEVPS
jgi:molybdopterin molybdotransferase